MTKDRSNVPKVSQGANKNIEIYKPAVDIINASRLAITTQGCVNPSKFIRTIDISLAKINGKLNPELLRELDQKN